MKLLKSATAGMESASKTVLANADEQDKASNGGGSGGGSGSGGSGSGDGAAQDLTDRLNGMAPEERQAYLGREAFRQRALENPEAAKAAMDAAADTRVIIVHVRPAD